MWQTSRNLSYGSLDSHCTEPALHIPQIEQSAAPTFKASDAETTSTHILEEKLHVHPRNTALIMDLPNVSAAPHRLVGVEQILTVTTRRYCFRSWII